MTEQLHDLLARIADQAGPGSSDPTLWTRAQRARRRDRAVRASVAALTALTLVGALAIGLGTRHAPPPAKQTPAPHETGVGIPSTVHGIHGDGGLDLETDLAVGPASVAIANQSGAFVITAADGVYHRLRLPGFDPTAFNDNSPGLALSPDGTRLAYGWRSPESGPRARAGTRILDLRTGALRKLPVGPPDVVGFVHLARTYGYGWSPNGRYLVFEVLFRGLESNHLYAGFDTAVPGAKYRVAAHSPPSHYFLWQGETRFAGSPCSGTGCTAVTVANRRDVARVAGSSLLLPGPQRASELPADASWAVGRFSPDGRRIVLHPAGVGTGLVLVSLLNDRPNPFGELSDPATLLSLDEADWPDGARIDVLGWVGPDHALAVVNRGTGPDTWEPGGELVLVDVSSVHGTTADDTPVSLDVVGRIEPGDPAPTYSFASDFATVDAPTQDFDAASSGAKISDPIGAGPIPSRGGNDGEATRLIAYAIGGLTVLAALTLALTRQRRKRLLPRDLG
jgi:hypothetical protein